MGHDSENWAGRIWVSFTLGIQEVSYIQAFLESFDIEQFWEK